MAYTSADLTTFFTNGNLGKAPTAAQSLLLSSYASQTQSGAISDQAAIDRIVDMLDGTTAVAVQSYQFFTGGTPSAAGLDYLVDSALNLNDLNDPAVAGNPLVGQYAVLNTENRYINFAINLGASAAGEGRANFLATYGTLSFRDVAAVAYETIIGTAAAQAAGVNVTAAIDFLARPENEAYLRAFVAQRAPGVDVELGIRAALVGQIMSAGSTSDVGNYNAATERLITGGLDGTFDNGITATSGVNLLTAFPNAPSAGKSFTLTAGPDAAPAFTGTTGDDTYVATNATLSASDSLNGSAGNDTLRYSSSGAVAVNQSGFDSASIETFQITSDAIGGTTFDTSNANGVTTLINDNSSSDLTITGLNVVTGITVRNTSQPTGATVNTTLNYNAAAVAGASTVQNVTLQNVFNPLFTPGTVTNTTITANGVETFNVTGNGTATSNIAGLVSNSLATVNVDGAQGVKIDSLIFAGATGVVDGSKSTGGINVTLTNSGLSDVTVTGGAGNDRADFSAGFAAKDSFTGGLGTDTLVLTNAVATGVVGGAVSGVEVLEVSLGGTGALDLSKFAGVNSVIYTGIAGTGNGLIGATTVSKTGATQAITIDAGIAGTANTLTTTVTADSANDALTLNINKVGVADVAGLITAADADTVTLNIADDAAVAGVGALSFAGLTVAKAKTITVTNNTDVTTTGAIGGALLTSLDASASTGKLDLSGGVTTALTGATIKLGATDDKLAATATAGVATGGDTITLGAGKDTVIYTAVAQSADKTSDTITDFVSGTDKLDLTGINVTSSAMNLGSRATFALAQGALTGAGIGAANTQVVFQQDANTLWVDNGDGQLDSKDFRIVLTGNTAVTNADLSLGTGAAVTLTATAAVVNLTTNTGASAKTTNEADTITGTYAFLNGSTIAGGQGTDSLTISGIPASNASSLTSLNAAGANTALVTAVETITLNDVTGNVNLGANFGADVKSLTVNGANSALTATTTAAGQTFVVGNTSAVNASAITLAHATTSVTLGAANDTVTTNAANSIGSTFNAGAGTDNLAFTGGGVLGGTSSNFETLTIDANSTVTTAQYSQFATTNGNFTLTFSDAGTATYVAGTTVTYVLASGGTFVGTAAANLSVTGAGGAETFNFGTALTAADTIAAGAGTDVLNVTGTANTSTVSAIETINFSTSTAAQTLTTGAQTNGNAYTITAAGSTVAVAVDASARTEAVALTIIDGAGADTITVSTTEASAALGVVTLSTGGSDTVVIGDLVHLAADANGVTINNFSTGIAAGADTLRVRLDQTAGVDALNDYVIVSAANQAVTNFNNANLYTAFEVNQAVAGSTNLTDVADGGLVEQALATAFGTVTNAGTDESVVVLYGVGAASGNAGIYSVVFANGADAVTGNMTVELIGVVNGVAADSFVQSNFG